MDLKHIAASASCLLLFGALGACGYSSVDTGDGPLPPAPGPAGYYAGDWLSIVAGRDDDAVALISDDGVVRIIDTLSGSQFVTELPEAGGDFQVDITGYAGSSVRFPDKSRVCHGTLAGTLYAAADLFGNYACGGEHGSVSLLFDDDISFNPPDPALLTGALQGFISPEIVLVLIVAPDGTYSGSDTNGCSYSGRFMADDPIIDIYAMSLKQVCGSTAVTLTGLASEVTGPGGQQMLYYGVSDSSHSLAGVLLFQ